MPKLTIVFDDAQEIVVPLADLLTVGSAEDNDIVVDDARLAAHHAEVALRPDGTVKVYDLGSATGTFVNGERVTKHTLADGDKLAFGPLKAILDLELGATHATAVLVPAAASHPRTSAGTRRIPLPSSTPPPEPQPLPSAEIHAAENRLALIEAAAKQAENNQRDWLAAVERLKKEHAEKNVVLEQLAKQSEEQRTAMALLVRELESKSATLLQLQTSITAAQVSLDSATARERETEAMNRQLQENLREAETRLAGLKRLSLDAEAQAREAASAQLLQESIASIQSRLDLMSAREREESQRLDQVRQTLTTEEARLAEIRRQISEGEARAREAAAIPPLQASIASVQARLEELKAQEEEMTQRAGQAHQSASNEEARLAELRRQVTEAAELEAGHRGQVEAAKTQLADLKSQIDGFSQAEEKLAALREAVAEAEKQQAKHSTAIAGLQEERQFQEQALTEVETQLAEAQESLADTKDELATEMRRLEELRARRAEFQAANDAPMEDLQRRMERARHDLGVIEARLRPVRDWKEAQERRLAQLSMLPPASPEAKELLREIDSEAADLLHIVNIPPSRTPRIIQVEAPYFQGVAMKSEHTRVSPATA